MTSRGEQFAYPIAVGREGKQWYGSTQVVSKQPHPEWRPTASMRQKNPRLPAVVKPGPSNPLGTRAIYLADGLLRIHGTNDPYRAPTKDMSILEDWMARHDAWKFGWEAENASREGKLVSFVSDIVRPNGRQVLDS
jgi:hypothetical protein